MGGGKGAGTPSPEEYPKEFDRVDRVFLGLGGSWRVLRSATTLKAFGAGALSKS